MRYLNIGLTVTMLVAYFGYDYEVVSYGTLLGLLLLTELCEIPIDKEVEGLRDEVERLRFK